MDGDLWVEERESSELGKRILNVQQRFFELRRREGTVSIE
jgi:hypothetical protein